MTFQINESGQYMMILNPAHDTSPTHYDFLLMTWAKKET